MSTVIPFSFEGTEVRVLDRDGEPWWVLTDVCKVLGIANAPHAAARLDDDEKATVAIGDSGNLNADRTIINESGLWSLVLTSRKPAAKRFKKWITGEVIPSIRKSGGYMVAASDETPEEIMLRALTIARETVERQKAENAALAHRNATLAPKAAAHEVLASIPGELGVTDAGRELKLGRQWVVNTIFARKWACRQGRDIRPAHYGLEMEYCRLVPRPYTDKNTGETKVAEDFKITRKGMGRLAELIAEAKRELEGEARPFAKKREAAA